MATKVMTPKFRVSFSNVFRPGKVLEEGKEPKYGLTLLFPKGADLSALKAAAQEAVTDKWGTDKTKWSKNLRTPFRDQGEKDFEGYEDGAIFINATSKQKPGLVDQNTQDIIDESEFYSGCYARATINAFTYDVKGNKGVAFGLNNVQKLGEGDPLGGRCKPQDDFEPVEDDGSANSSSDTDDMFG